MVKATSPCPNLSLTVRASVPLAICHEAEVCHTSRKLLLELPISSLEEPQANSHRPSFPRQHRDRILMKVLNKATAVRAAFSFGRNILSAVGAWDKSLSLESLWSGYTLALF